MNRLLILVVAISTAVGLLGLRALAPDRRVGVSREYAKLLVMEHARVAALVRAAPATAGPVVLAAQPGHDPGAIRHCVAAGVAASWIDQQVASGYRPIAAMLAQLGSVGDAGVAAGGFVTGPAGPGLALPCAIPDGVPTIATRVL